MFVDGLDQEAKKQLMAERAEQRNEQGILDTFQKGILT